MPITQTIHFLEISGRPFKAEPTVANASSRFFFVFGVGKLFLFAMSIYDSCPFQVALKQILYEIFCSKSENNWFWGRIFALKIHFRTFLARP